MFTSHNHVNQPLSVDEGVFKSLVIHLLAQEGMGCGGVKGIFSGTVLLSQ